MAIGAQGRHIDDDAKPVAGLGDAIIPIVNDNEEEPTVTVDPETGVVTTSVDDGGVIVNFDPGSDKPDNSEEFDQNLCEILDSDELGKIAADLLEGIQADLDSRKEWESNMADAMIQLGLQKEIRSNLDLDTISKCRHPLLLECVLDFWANFQGEFLPSEGPVKVEVDDADDETADDEADELEQDLNHYLTVTATEYYPDTSRAGFRIGLMGGITKQVYYCALRERPVSEAIYLDDLIVSNEATDLDNAKRVTKRMMYLAQDIKEMEDAEIWSETPLGTAMGSDSEIKKTVAEIQGVKLDPDRPDDKQHTIYECHTKIMIEKDAKAKERFDRGLPCPYKITLDKDGMQVKAIYRLWKEDDEFFRKQQQFVPWFYCPGLGFYPIGLAQILGNDTSTLTALWREMVDMGMFANFPGFLYLDSLGRQDTNRFKIPPAGGQPIKAPPGMSIKDAVMAPPYKDITPGLFQLAQHIEDMARKKAGAAKIPIGEGKTDIPVGSLLMFIEQSTKLVQAIHKGLHTSQKREFELLKDLFVKHPEDLTKFNKDKKQKVWTSEQLQNRNLAPKSDPNTPSHLHRLSTAVALFMMAQQAPQLFDLHEVATYIFSVLHLPNAQRFMAPPVPPTPPEPPDPAKMAAIQQKEQDAQRKAATQIADGQQRKQELLANLQNDAQNRASQERIANMQNQTEQARLAVDLAREHMKAQAGLHQTALSASMKPIAQPQASP